MRQFTISQIITNIVLQHNVLKYKHGSDKLTVSLDSAVIINAARRAGLERLLQINTNFNETSYENWAKEIFSDGYEERNPDKIKLVWVLKQARKKYFDQFEKSKSEGEILRLGYDALHNLHDDKKPNKDITIVRTADKGTVVFSQIELQDQSVLDDGNQPLSDGSTNTFRQCDFCNKETIIFEQNQDLLERLSGGRGFYCLFCLNHDFHTKKSRHILQLTFRSIIAYLYETCYSGKSPKLYYVQIKELIDYHEKIGRLNPVFSYDSETYCWYVDFSKVGKSSSKIPLRDVIRTVNEIISAFNPYEYIKDFKSSKLTEKYEEAIIQFYQKRSRPDGKRLLAPTLIHCACDTKEIPMQHNVKRDKKMELALHREFLPTNFRLHYRR